MHYLVNDARKQNKGGHNNLSEKIFIWTFDKRVFVNTLTLLYPCILLLFFSHHWFLFVSMIKLISSSL